MRTKLSLNCSHRRWYSPV